ncbi:MAG: glutathione S-transferase family protein [Proteobacteria bacterium]|nr:glutathione S-transferase family protein [Pseudomonadota bacterium]
MTLKIYGIAASRAIRPLWAAEELGLPYEHIKLHYHAPELKQPAYLSMNPNGLVPVIDDNGLVLYESLAITSYLAQRYGQGGLWPTEVEQQARALQWTLWAATEAEPPARQWFQHTQFLPEPQRQSALAEAGLAKAREKVLLLEQVLSDRPFLLGNEFTIADLNVSAVLQRLPAIAGDSAPKAVQWHQRCFTRPAAQRAFALRDKA